MPVERERGYCYQSLYLEINFSNHKLTKDKGQAISIVDAPAEDAIGHAPVGGCEDLSNQGAAHRSEEGEVSLENIYQGVENQRVCSL